MKKIIIIGGGFGGRAALRRLLRHRNLARVSLIDVKETSDFLPLLPDCLGRGIEPEFIKFKIENFCAKANYEFIKSTVRALELARKEVVLGERALNYDYLIIAAGSETNFYGNGPAKKFAFKLNNLNDAEVIRGALKKNSFDNCLISGGGYTGIEAATNLRRYWDKKKIDKRIVIIERAPSILGPLPQWMKQYVTDNLKRLNIEVLVNTVVEKIESGSVYLSGGRAFVNSMLIWAAGVKAPDFIQGLRLEKNPQARLKVDEYLRAENSCFVAGDAANFSYGKTFLRMAVQFAIMQGSCAADNIIRGILRKPLRRYRPMDLGYIIPMANNYSCGIVFGVKIKGRLATFLHYCMCVYRSYGLKNKLGVLKGLLKGGRRWTLRFWF